MNEDFLDLISAFIDAEVHFVVVGGYAVAAHGHPRATKHIDIFVDATPENADRVLTGLRAFGAPLFGLTRDDLSEPGKGLMLGAPPRRIDILTKLDGVDFPKVWTSRVTVPVEHLEVPFIDRELLIRNKRASGRPQDLADIDHLERK